MSSSVSAFDRLEPARVDVDRVGREPLRRDLEADARARRRLEEHVDRRCARAGSARVLISRCEISSIASAVSSTCSISSRLISSIAEQVVLHHRPRTSSSPVRAARAAPPASAREVGMFLPTKSTLIGSSRWPRSTSTATWIARGPPEVEHRVHRRAHRAAREHHVVDQHHALPVDRERHARRPRHRPHAARDHVVAVEGDVERADADRAARELAELRGDQLGHRLARRARSRPARVLGAGVALEDLVRDSRRGALDARRIENDASAALPTRIGSASRVPQDAESGEDIARLCPPLGDGLKGSGSRSAAYPNAPRAVNHLRGKAGSSAGPATRWPMRPQRISSTWNVTTRQSVKNRSPMKLRCSRSCEAITHDQ